MIKKLLIGVLLFACQFIAVEAQERTLAIVKPDAVKANHIGGVIDLFEKGGLQVVAIKMQHMTRSQAQQFYAAHKEKPFYEDLVNYMSSGPIVTLVLEGNDAVTKGREIIGSTDPKNAAPGTIRAMFGQTKTYNAVHGSDSADNAKTEIAFFFKPQDLFTH